LEKCLLCKDTEPGEFMSVPFAETLHSDKPGEILHFDFLYMGPSLTGELYALILKDDASMYTWLIAAKRADADTVVNALMQWNAAFGTSTTWISDQAWHFKCEVINKLRKALRVLHALTPAYTRRANGTMEAVCKQVLRSGRALLVDFGLQPDQWPEVLPLIQSVLNNSSSTRLARRSSMQVFTGRKAPNPLALALAPTAVIPVEYSFAQAQKAAQADELQSRVAEIHKAAAQASTSRRQVAIERHNAKTHVNKANFSVGDFVLVPFQRKSGDTR
jgi:hypothetical protein